MAATINCSPVECGTLSARLPFMEKVWRMAALPFRASSSRTAQDQLVKSSSCTSRTDFRGVWDFLASLQWGQSPVREFLALLPPATVESPTVFKVWADQLLELCWDSLALSSHKSHSHNSQHCLGRTMQQHCPAAFPQQEGASSPFYSETQWGRLLSGAWTWKSVLWAAKAGAFNCWTSTSNPDQCSDCPPLVNITSIRRAPLQGWASLEETIPPQPWALKCFKVQICRTLSAFCLLGFFLLLFIYKILNWNVFCPDHGFRMQTKYFVLKNIL